MPTTYRITSRSGERTTLRSNDTLTLAIGNARDWQESTAEMLAECFSARTLRGVLAHIERKYGRNSHEYAAHADGKLGRAITLAASEPR